MYARNKLSLYWLISAASHNSTVKEEKSCIRHSLPCFRQHFWPWEEKKTFPWRLSKQFTIWLLNTSQTSRKSTQMDCMWSAHYLFISETSQDWLTISGNTSNTHWPSITNHLRSRLDCPVCVTLLRIMGLNWATRFLCWWNTWSIRSRSNKFQESQSWTSLWRLVTCSSTAGFCACLTWTRSWTCWWSHVRLRSQWTIVRSITHKLYAITLSKHWLAFCTVATSSRTIHANSCCLLLRTFSSSWSILRTSRFNPR